jgi:polyhydroxybutyrate depolymerase
MNCRFSGKAIPVLIMNGTGDPYQPYNGGLHTVFGTQLSPVLSTRASAEYFAKLNGQISPPKTTRLPHQNPSDPTSVDRTVWNDAGKPEVVLVTINEGGHLLPQSKGAWPANYGRTTFDVDGPAEIWEFFARQRPLK